MKRRYALSAIFGLALLPIASAPASANIGGMTQTAIATEAIETDVIQVQRRGGGYRGGARVGVGRVGVAPQGVGRVGVARVASRVGRGAAAASTEAVTSIAAAPGCVRAITGGRWAARLQPAPRSAWSQQAPRHGPASRPDPAIAGTTPTRASGRASGINARSSAQLCNNENPAARRGFCCDGRRRRRSN